MCDGELNTGDPESGGLPADGTDSITPVGQPDAGQDQGEAAEAGAPISAESLSQGDADQPLLEGASQPQDQGLDTPPEDASPPSVVLVAQEVSTVPLAALETDATFQLRTLQAPDDIAALATDIARLGQLFPIDVRPSGPDRYQVISGFRRVASLNLLQRETVVARIHRDMSAPDAALLALAATLNARSISSEELEQFRERAEAVGILTLAVREMIERWVSGSQALGPEQFEEEVDGDELATDVTLRLGQINQDLSLLADVFKELSSERRSGLLEQLRYSAQLVAFLEESS